MNQEEIAKQLDQILSQFKKYAPLISDYFEIDKPIRQYSETLFQIELDEVFKKRQALLVEILSKKIKDIFGKKFSDKLNIKTPLVCSIVDHQQVLNHPLLMAGNIISQSSNLFKKNSEPIIVISSADVPPNNFFSKNGFQFAGKRVPLFSNSEKEVITHLLPKRNFDFVERLKTIDRWKEFDEKEKEFLCEQERDINKINFENCKNYENQISLVVREQWKKLFRPENRQEIPELLYISQEDITTEMLYKLLLDKNIITDILFDEKKRDLLLSMFRGIVVAWNETEGKGAHFFWAKKPGSTEALRLYLKDGYLEPYDSRFREISIKFEPKVLVDMMTKGEIFPSLFMIFWVLNFYSGIKPLLGHGSLVYMNILRDRWFEYFKKIGYEKESELMHGIDLSGLIVGPAFFFSRDNLGQLYTPYAFDIMFEGGKFKKYFQKMLQEPFSHLLMTAVPEMYSYYANKYIPKDEHIKITVESNQIAEDLFDWI